MIPQDTDIVSFVAPDELLAAVADFTAATEWSGRRAAYDVPSTRVLMQQPISYGDPYGSTMEAIPPPGSNVPANQLAGTDFHAGPLPGTTLQ